MVRRYEEPIEVRAPSPGHEGAPAEEAPDTFVWRGRLYVVQEVLDHWRERRAWWRDALDRESTGAMASGGTSSGGRGSGTASGERDVWRVAARPGRSASTGVYDLGSDGAPDRWLLLRAED